MKFTLGRFHWGYRHYDGGLHAGSLWRMLVGITPVKAAEAKSSYDEVTTEAPADPIRGYTARMILPD